MHEVYADVDDVILVASDRVSVVVLPTPIPDNGAILTQLSLWWFRQGPVASAGHAARVRSGAWWAVTRLG